jgi:hypothetical protein
MSLANEYEEIPCLVKINQDEIKFTCQRPTWSIGGHTTWPCMSLTIERRNNQSTIDDHLVPKTQLKLASIRNLMAAATPAVLDDEISGWKADVDYINSSGGCDYLIFKPGISKGAVFVSIAKQLSHLLDVDYALLQDAATIYCNAKGSSWISLKMSNALKEGIPWYSRFGFIYYENDDGLRFIGQVLPNIKWQELVQLSQQLSEQISNELDSANFTPEAVLEALNCTVCPSTSTCDQNISVKHVLENTSKTMCTNTSFLFRIFQSKHLVNAILKKYKIQDKFKTSRINQIFKDSSASYFIWFRRPSILSNSTPIFRPEANVRTSPVAATTALATTIPVESLENIVPLSISISSSSSSSMSAKMDARQGGNQFIRHHQFYPRLHVILKK